MPQKYRSPIVLCYFEGMTHDEAAATLGWPVGTVKGRLSRARDLLRARFTRRGIAVSSAALAAHLGGTVLKASVPPSLVHLTCKTAMAVVASGGASIAASAAVSPPVASLTEGALHAMILSHVKSVVIPIVVAAGLLSTGATVVAFQYAGQGGAQALASAVPRPEVEELPMPGNLAPVTRVPMHSHKQGIPTRQAGPSHKGTRKLEEAAEM